MIPAGATPSSHLRKRYCRRLVDDEQLRLREQGSVRRLDVLNRLAVRAENIDADDGSLELRVGRLNDTARRWKTGGEQANTPCKHMAFRMSMGRKRPPEIGMLLVVDGVEALEEELKESAQILGRRCGDKDVGVAVSDSRGEGETRVAEVCEGEVRRGALARVQLDRAIGVARTTHYRFASA
eukprot:scaffold60091_cov28-Tisochrysis_lutea.AAC.3